MRGTGNLGLDGFDRHLFVQHVLLNLHLDDLVSERSSNLFQRLLLGLSDDKLVDCLECGVSQDCHHLRIEEVDDEEVNGTASDKHVVVVLSDVLKGTGAGLGN